MEKLCFDWDSSANESIAEVSGFRVRAVQDSDAGNPWDEWDGQPPLIVNSGRSAYSESGDVPSPLEGLTDSWIAKHWRELCKVFETNPEEAKERKEADGYFKIADAKRDLLDKWLTDAKPSRYSGNAGDYMTLLESLYTLRGWPCLNTCSQGHSQGDYADLLLIFSPAYAEVIGRKWPRSKADRAAIIESLKADAETWGAWAWGEVYGFVIEDSKGAALPGDCLDSCWGFYGSDFDKSGLAEAAGESLSYIRKKRRRLRQAKVRELIKARVPLAVRAEVLKGFPA